MYDTHTDKQEHAPLPEDLNPFYNNLDVCTTVSWRVDYSLKEKVKGNALIKRFKQTIAHQFALKSAFKKGNTLKKRYSQTVMEVTVYISTTRTFALTCHCSITD